MQRTLKLVSILLLALWHAGGTSSPQGVFLAGVAVRDVTPQEPVPMWGYSARRDTLSAGVRDPLRAEALVIQAGPRRLAIVGLDLGRTPSEEVLTSVRSRIREKAGVDFSFLNASHTHHGPVLELTDEDGKGRGRFGPLLAYYQMLEDRIVDAVVEAASNLKPVRIGTGAVKLEGFNRNRHSMIEPKPRDPELSILRLDDYSGRTIATLVNFAAHPTMLPAEMLEFSADFVGPLKLELEHSVGGVALFLQGAAGDLAVDSSIARDPTAFGAALARECVTLAKSIETTPPTTPSLKWRETRLTFSSRTDFGNPIVRLAYSRAFFPELIANYLDEYAQGIRPRLSVALLNERIALVGVSGEFFSAHSVRLRERALVERLFFLGYTNGYHQYFPTIEAVAEGGYGADNRVAPAEVGAGEAIMNQALIWIYELLGRIDQ